MQTFTDLGAARQELRDSGGVLLQTGDTPKTYAVMEFSEAAEMRNGNWGSTVTASYWASMGQIGFDETLLGQLNDGGIYDGMFYALSEDEQKVAGVW